MMTHHIKNKYFIKFYIGIIRGLISVKTTVTTELSKQPSGPLQAGIVFLKLKCLYLPDKGIWQYQSNQI